MKAWMVSGDPDGNAGAVIVHAETRGAARNAGQVQLQDFGCAWIDMRVVRAPKWDDQPLPTKRELFLDGWWFFCCNGGCAEQVHEDDPHTWVDDEHVRCRTCMKVK